MTINKQREHHVSIAVQSAWNRTRTREENFGELLAHYADNHLGGFATMSDYSEELLEGLARMDALGHREVKQCPVNARAVLLLIAGPQFKPMDREQRLGFAGAGPDAVVYDRNADFLIILDEEDGKMTCRVYASGSDDSWQLDLATGEVEVLQ